MPEISRHPADRCVTVIAGVATGNVGCVLAGCAQAIVAPNAIANDTAVIKNSREPGRRAVTIVALVVGGNVVRCFPGRLNAVVTAYTIAGYGRVIHECDDGPVRSDMAVRALS